VDGKNPDSHPFAGKIGGMTNGTDLASKGRVLVVDDDASLAEMLMIVLRQEGFEGKICSRGDLALDAFRQFRPDLVLLDVMLPGKDGIDVCKEIRAESGVPIVMLTARGDTIDVVVGLETGADDYVVKPFKPKELVARIRARVRRFDATDHESLNIGDLAIDVAGHSVTRSGRHINLTPLEFDLLVCLARKPWQVFTREVLLEQVWGYRHAADTAWSTCTSSACGPRSSTTGEPGDRGDGARGRLQGRDVLRPGRYAVASRSLPAALRRA